MDGPVCLAESARGQGQLPRLYDDLEAHLGGREAILLDPAEQAPLETLALCIAMALTYHRR